MKRALIFSGGGSRGAYEIGCWKALSEMGIRFHAVYGTSIGAINAALFAQGDLKTAETLWKEIRIDQIVRTDDPELSLDAMLPNKRDLVGFLKENRKMIYMDISPLEKLLEEKLSEARIRAMGLELGLMTVRVPQMQSVPVRLSSMAVGSLQDWLIASASCFPVFPLKRIGNERYVDGGFIDNLPIDMALLDGCEEIVAVDLHPDPAHPEYHAMPFLKLIHPLHTLGGFLDFSPRLLERARRLGYNDTMKAYGRCEGVKYTFYASDPLQRASAARRYALQVARFDARAISRGAFSNNQAQNAPLIRALSSETPLKKLSWNDVWLRGLELLAETMGFRDDALYRAERLIGLCLDLAKRSAPDRELTPDRMAKLLTESRRELVVHIFQWLRERGGCHEDMVPPLAKAPRETAAALFMMYAVD